MYRKLDIEFDIPELLKEEIDSFLEYLNTGGRLGLADCYEEDIRSTLNGCDLCLTDEQVQMLRDYYCRGGIYKNDDI